MLAVASDCSLVARGLAGKVEHLTDLIKAGIQHKGFAQNDILQPCVSFNRVNTFKWYSDRVYRINASLSHDAEDCLNAFKTAQQWGDKIPIGIIYRNQRQTLGEQIPAIADQPLVAQQTNPKVFSELLENSKHKLSFF